jgi:putative membrane-bound dehydrogenase-like protein
MFALMWPGKSDGNGVKRNRGSILTMARVAVGGLVLALVLPAPARPQGFSPEEAVQRMQVPEGLAVRLVAAEPLVRQPVAIDFDDRGRLWVIQYLQYPNPAGLKRVQVDRYSRTVYDRIPEPPPRGPRGADRITILDDFDERGRARRGKDFIAGLNLATGMAFGHGGVFVLQAPYLLFYPDRDGDDVPDGDPEVLLSGFGMEDAHSVANSLTWGPDGWLYGCQGSTVTAHIRGIEFQQGVWRYHPVTRGFELFCEGGGNCWGLDFDRHGNLLYSTNVGGHVVMHGVQGAYGWKAFGKHGPLHNPYAYGFLDHVPHRDFRGGHVTTGGIIYRGDSFPDRFRDRLIAGDLLGHAVYWHELEPAGSTFRSHHGGELLRANDTWFAPCDLTLGPDGAVYVADWYDKRTAHPDPDAEWDRSNGRVYKIEAAGTKHYSGEDLRKLSSDRLVSLLSHRNDWFVRRARRLLAERRDPSVLARLRVLVRTAKDDSLALEAFWALYGAGGWDDAFALEALEHCNADIRRWAVRFVGDECRTSPRIADQLVKLAQSEADVSVRAQLACSAKRLLGTEAQAILRPLLLRDEDAGDPHLPLLLWWAVERHAITARATVLEFFTSSAAWKSSLVREAILGLLTRRYAAEGTPAGYEACARLLASAPTSADHDRLLVALEQGLSDRKPTAPIHLALDAQLAALWKDDTTDAVLLRILVRFGRQSAEARALVLATDPRTPAALRTDLLGLLGEAGSPVCVGPMLKILQEKGSEAVRLAALDALQHFNCDEVAEALLTLYPTLQGRLQARACEVLLARRTWAYRFLRGVEEGKFPAAAVSLDQVRTVALHRDARLDALVRKHWGNIRAATPEEKLAEVRRLNNDLRAGAGDPRRGRALFTKHCAVCHQLFGEGGKVGPDLTHANRKDRDFLLVSLVDPSAVIRKEYLSHIVHTSDGRVLTGLLAEQTASAVTLVDAKGERTVIPRDRIESLEESPISLMPEDVLKDLQPDDLRDLFAYLQADLPIAP